MAPIHSDRRRFPNPSVGNRTSRFRLSRFAPTSAPILGFPIFPQGGRAPPAFQFRQFHFGCPSRSHRSCPVMLIVDACSGFVSCAVLNRYHCSWLVIMQDVEIVFTQPVRTTFFIIICIILARAFAYRHLRNSVFTQWDSLRYFFGRCRYEKCMFVRQPEHAHMHTCTYDICARICTCKQLAVASF